MARLISSLGAVLIGAVCTAQNIGINTDGASPHPSAILDIDVSAMLTNKAGLLVPRMTTVERNTISAPATSLLIFNTTTAQFEYFDGTVWRGLLSTATAGWGLTGNTGTNPTTNFLGTTDAQPLRFRVSNTFAGQLPSATNGLFSLGLNAGAVTTGTFNTFLGNGTGGANTTGSGNTYVGGFAGASNVTGSDNVYLGRLAGVSALTNSSVLVGYETGPLVTSFDNVMVGKWAGMDATSGHSNTFLGANSGLTTSTGSENVYVGESAGNLNITGSGNTFLGQASSGLPSSISNATAIGHQALAGGSNTMVLGSIAGVNGATATVNVGIGVSLPQDRLHVVGSIRMADGNQAIGRIPVSDANGRMTWTDPLTVASNLAWTLTGNAGTNPTTNFLGTTDAQHLRFRVNNTFAGQVPSTTTAVLGLGLNAGASATGTNNTFIGTNAGAATTTGGNNTFIGNGAGAANTTLGSNVYVGQEAGNANATGQENVYIGRRAGALGTSGSTNVLIGNGAGIQNTANNNVIIGGFAGGSNTIGGGNTFVGTQAGSGTNTGGQNTFIGTNAGTGNTTGQQLTVIGNGAGVGANNLTNATAIGRSSRADTDNSLVLGSVAGINGATTTVNVGIGVNAPLDRLHVVGNIRMVDGNQAANRVMVSDANGTASWQTLNTATTNAWSLTGNAGTSAITNFIGTTDNQMLRFRTNNSEVLRLTANGRAEIGGAPIPALFATGSSKLLVASEVNGEENLTVWAAHNTAAGRATLALARQRGSFSLFNNVLNGDGLGEVVFSGYASTSTHVPAASIHCDVDGAPNLLSVPGKLAFSTSPFGASAPIERMTIRSDGAVGIGTITPDQHTEIEGTGDQYLRVTSTNAVVAGVEFKRSGFGFSDWQVRNDGGLLLFGQSADELATVTDVLRLGGGSVTPATDNAITCGQAALRWTNVFAVNGTINTSDAREKQDVRALNYGLAEVMQLKPVRFRWKNDPAQGDKLGLIAQDLQGVLPETVVDKSWRVNDDGTREEVPAERLGVYYSDLIPVLIKAVQEQQQQIEQLREELARTRR